MSKETEKKPGFLKRTVGTESFWQKGLASFWGFSFFWIGGALLLLAERLLTLYYLPEKLPVQYAFAAWAMDLFWPLLFFTLALLFRQALIASVSYLLLFFVVVFHGANLVILSRTIHVLDAAMAVLIWENCGDVPFRIYFGEHYREIFGACGAGLLLLLIFAAAAFRYSYKICKAPKFVRFLCWFFLIALLSGGVASAVTYEYVRNNVLYKGWFPREWGARPVHQYMIDFAEELRKEHPKLTQGQVCQEGFFPAMAPNNDDLDLLRDMGIVGEGAIQFPNLVSPVVQEPKYDKILMIVLESMDLDFLLSGMPPGLTPFMSPFFRGRPLHNAGFHCFVLSECYCSAQPTAEGINALLSSRLDYPADLYFRNPSLLSILKEQGYATKIISGVSRDFHNQKEEFMQVFSPGEAIFLEDLFVKAKIKGNSYWGVDDPSLYRAVYKILNEEKNPRQCVVVSTVDTHPPYRASNWSGKDYGSSFLNAIAAADHNLKEFLDMLAQSPWWDDRTLVILTSDHTATHGENYRRRVELIPERVPLVFLSKKPLVIRQMNQAKFCCSLDVAPTILSLLALPTPRTFMGRSLVGDGPVSRTISLYGRKELHYRNRKGKLLRVSLDEPVTKQEKALVKWYRTYYGN